MKVAFGLLIVGLFATGFAPVRAQDVGQHPAVFAPRSLPGVDPSTFIVGHPASPYVRVGHPNADHPAVRVKQSWRQGQVDPNLFVVRPPAGVHWADGVAGERVAALAPGMRR